MRFSIRPLNMFLMAIGAWASRVAEFCGAGLVGAANGLIFRSADQ
jgi:hypothetical protein